MHVICVARFVPRKRQEVLIRAVASLVVAGRAVICEFVGSGPTLEMMRATAASCGAPEAFLFSGRLPQAEAAARVREADIFVLCSLWEGMPGSVLEAMSAGLPVVATDVSGTREVVVDGETGLLVPPDDAQRLADALASLIDDVELRVTLGRAGRRKVAEEYSFDRLVAAKEAFFASIAGRASA